MVHNQTIYEVIIQPFIEFAGGWFEQMIAVLATAFIALIGYGIYGIVKLIIHLIDEIKYETR